MKRSPEYYATRKRARRAPHPRRVGRDYRARVRASLLQQMAWVHLPRVVEGLLQAASKSYAQAVHFVYSWDYPAGSLAQDVQDGVRMAAERTRGVY